MRQPTLSIPMACSRDSSAFTSARPIPRRRWEGREEHGTVLRKLVGDGRTAIAAFGSIG